MKKIFIYLFALSAALSITYVAQSKIVDVCGTDTLILKAGNFQYGTIQWQESVDLVSWKNIPNAKEPAYRFFPAETKYYRAAVIYSDCPPGYSDTSFVQLPPAADAGADRIVPGNSVLMTANIEIAATGTWSVISGTNGSFSDVNDPKTQFHGSDTMYVLGYSLSNACGASKDTMRLRFRTNQYIDPIVVVDTTDLLLSDSAQMAQGNYKIYFSSPVPVITDSTILVGIINDGFLRKVESFTVLADTFTMQTSQATLEDIIIDGSVNVAQTFGMDTTVVGKLSKDQHFLDHIPTRLELNTDPKFRTNEIYYYVPGRKVEYIHDGIALNKKMTGNYLTSDYFIGVKFNNITLFDTNGVSLKLNGYYKFEPNIIADLDFKGLTLKAARIGMYNGIIERNYQLTLSAAATLSLIDKSFTLLSVKKPLMMIIAGVPVLVVTQLSLNGKVSADLSASMNFAHEYTKTSMYNANMEYLNSQWTYNYNESSRVLTGNSSSVTGALTQDFEIGPEISFKIYGIMGPYITAKLTEDLNVCTDLSANWKADMNIGGNLSVGAKAKVASWIIFDVSKTWAQNFYTLQLPHHIAIESGNNQNYTAGNALPNEIKVKVTANKGFSVPGAKVHFNPLSGGSVTSSAAVTGINGIASTVWTPGGSVQSRLEASILDCNGDTIGNSPVLFYAYQSGNCAKSSLSVSITKSGNTICPLAHLGIPPYTYSIDGSSFSAAVPQITPAAGMIYTFTVKDNNGCIASESYTEPSSSCANSGLALNVQVSSSTVTATAQGGAPPYLYALDAGSFSSVNVFGNVSAGNHIVYAKDALACVASWSITVTLTGGPQFSTMTDSRDGKVYTIVKIGNQWWFAENLNYGTYAPVTSPQLSGTKFCQNLSGTNDPACPMGGLYEWANLMQGSGACNGTGAPPNDKCATPVQGLCPAGWHIPSHYEWTTLEKNVGTNPGAFPYDITTTGPLGTDEGGNMKVTPICGSLPCWNTPNTGATNSSGFTALPGGLSDGAFGSLVDAGNSSYWWTTTENIATAVWLHYLYQYQTQVYRYPHNSKDFGYSVRCVKD